MIVLDTAISGVYRVQTSVHEDERGIFFRGFCDQKLDAVLHGRRIRQINISTTKMVGAIRGLHFQYPPKAEMKMIRCLAGAVWDVAVDLRRGSETFLQWVGATLAPNDAQMLIIPEGCAHGFQVLQPGSQLLYLHTAPYAPENEGGIRPDDPRIAISWPLPVSDISERDRRHALLDLTFEGIDL